MEALEATIRPARPGDMPAIRRLIRLHADKLMQTDLPGRQSFFVAETPEDRIVGCAALQVYSKRLGEVRSLAVDPEYGLQGVGRRLVQACQQRARERGVRQVLAVTSAVGFFEKAGFSTFKQERVALFYDVEAPREE